MAGYRFIDSSTSKEQKAADQWKAEYDAKVKKLAEQRAADVASASRQTLQASNSGYGRDVRSRYEHDVPEQHVAPTLSSSNAGVAVDGVCVRVRDSYDPESIQSRVRAEQQRRQAEAQHKQEEARKREAELVEKRRFKQEQDAKALAEWKEKQRLAAEKAKADEQRKADDWERNWNVEEIVHMTADLTVTETRKAAELAKSYGDGGSPLYWQMAIKEVKKLSHAERSDLIDAKERVLRDATGYESEAVRLARLQGQPLPE